MFQLDLQILPAAIGGTMCLLWRLFSVRVPSRCAAASAGGKDSEDEMPSCLQLVCGGEHACLEPGPEPGPEPSPEPSPDRVNIASSDNVTAAPTPTPSSALRWFSSRVAATMLVLVWLLGFWLLAGSAVASHGLPFAHVVKVPAPLAVLVDQGAVSASLPIDAKVAVREENEEQEEDERELSEDGAGGHVVTLKLTRQQTTTRVSNGVVYYKSAYWGTLHVGSPAMPFKVVFDTGSGHLILPSTYCSSETCRVHKRYRPSASTSGKNIDQDGSIVQPGAARDQISVSFGTGEVTGVFVEDIVCMEDFSSFVNRTTSPEAEVISVTPFTPFSSPPSHPPPNDSPPPTPPSPHPIPSPAGESGTERCIELRMIAATEMSEDPFKTFKFDGVLGLGLAGLSQSPEFNFLHVVAQSVRKWGGKRPTTFGIFLAEDENEESAITLGGWAKEKIGHDLAWNPVFDPELGHWLVSIKSMSVDGEPVTFCNDGTCRGVVDTGTALMAVPSKAFPELFELLRHPSSNREGTCHGPGPKLHVELETITLTLEPSDFARLEEQKVPSTNRWPTFKMGLENKTEVERTMYCKPMMMTMDLPAPLGPKLFILGEPVIRKYYTVFDSSKPPRIGFARAMHSEAPFRDLSDSDESWFADDDDEA